MPRDPVTKVAMFPQLERLNLVFTKYTVEQLRALAGGYAEALNDLDMEMVGESVSLALKEEPRFPPPVKLREYAKRWAQHARPILPQLPAARTEEGPQPVCRTCGAEPRLAWLEGQVFKAGRMTDETFQHKRYIAPCNPKRHGAEGYVPFPPNFIGWADA